MNDIHVWKINGRRTKAFVTLTLETINELSAFPEAMAMWLYLISKPSDWIVNQPNISNSMGWGRNKVYSLLNILIKLGYAYRYQIRKEGKGNLFGIRHVEIFEEKMSPEEIKKCFPHPQNRDKAKSDKLKESLPRPCFGYAEIGDTENRDHTYKEDKPMKEVNLESPYGDKGAAPLPAAKAAPFEEIDISNTEIFINRLRVIKPDVKIPPNLKDWRMEMRKLRALDGRKSENIAKVIAWLGTPDCWFKALNPKDLRKKFDSIEMTMSNPIKNFTKHVSKAMKDENGIPLDRRDIHEKCGF